METSIQSEKNIFFSDSENMDMITDLSTLSKYWLSMEVVGLMEGR